MATDTMWVVETYSGEAYLGRVEFEHGKVIIYTGFVGRPCSIPQSEIESMTTAENHPDVEVTTPMVGWATSNHDAKE